MSATGNKHVYVPCSACEGTGIRKGLNHLMEFKQETCNRCQGKGERTVARKAA